MKYGVETLIVAGLTLVLFVGSANSQTHFRNHEAGYSGMGDPLPEITNNPTDLTNFVNGQLNMKEIETLNPATNPTGPAGQLRPPPPIAGLL